MKVYKTVVSHEICSEVEEEVFTKEMYEEVLRFICGKSLKQQKLSFVISDDPKHQQIFTMDLCISDSEYHDLFIGRNVLLPAIGSNEALEYEVEEGVILEWTRDPKEYLLQFIGKKFVRDTNAKSVYSNGFSARDHLAHRLKTIYGYDNNKINEIIYFDIDNPF